MNGCWIDGKPEGDGNIVSGIGIECVTGWTDDSQQTSWFQAFETKRQAQWLAGTANGAAGR
jgi:hypothetical protein